MEDNGKQMRTRILKMLSRKIESEKKFFRNEKHDYGIQVLEEFRETIKRYT